MPLSAGAQSYVEESIHGVIIRDPYRWLEDGSSLETREWVADQQQRYDEYFSHTEDLNLFRERVREYLDVETVDQPARIANQYFYRRRDKGCEQASIYVRDTSMGKERLLVDPSTRGKFASVAIHRISLDGSLLAYESRQGGADATAIHIVDVDSGVELPDKIEPGYARGFTFTTNREGFYYCQENAEAFEHHTIRLHRFGERSTDEVVYQLPRSAGSKLVLTSDELHLGIIFVHLHNGERVTDLSLARRDTPTGWKYVFANLHRTYRPFLKNGRVFAISFQDAPNGMLLELNESGCEARVIIPEQAQMIQQLVVVGNRIVVTYLHDWTTVVESWTVSGKYLGRLKTPIDGTIRLLQSQGSDALFCTYESFSEPPAIFEFLADSGRIEVWHKQANPAERKTCNMRPVFVTSKDGTRIPLMLVNRGNPELASNIPVIMTGYGGFGTSVTPQYSVLVSIMLGLDSTFALARIRGGGEFGNAWHDAGRRGGRQNAFDDFIAAAEWLCANGVTTPERLAIFGGSNAGLLVGAVLTQRPELFGAVLCIAPLLDMVRYETFDQASRWRHEYGSVDDAEDFRTLHAYSPYHHIEEEINYPPILFVSGDKDDRCNPAHVRKMAARLQQRNVQTHPVLVDYSRDRGHSPMLPLSVRVESLARRITFLCRALNITRHRSSQ
jgi:prolyl oligopeptidase